MTRKTAKQAVTTEDGNVPYNLVQSSVWSGTELSSVNEPLYSGSGLDWF